MKNFSPLVRVSHRNRCKVCGHSDWCSFTEDGQLAFCMRRGRQFQASRERRLPSPAHE